jgi:hypothetical protein
LRERRLVSRYRGRRYPEGGEIDARKGKKGRVGIARALRQLLRDCYRFFLAAAAAVWRL